MKLSDLLFTQLALCFTITAHADSLRHPVISAGAATLSNGSVVNIGQSFVGNASSPMGGALMLGIIPLLQLVPLPPVPTNNMVLSDAKYSPGFFQLTSPSVPGMRNILEGTTDFRQWVPLKTNIPLGNINIEHTDRSDLPHRFYRLRLE